MGHDHSHDHHHHGHHDHGHNHHASPEEKAFIKSRKEGGAVSRAINDFKARVFKGEHWHQHGDHAHTYEINKGGRVAIVAGSVASLGVALHGADNMRRGAFGYKDNELNQEYAPSARRFLMGAAEVAGGLALAKRIGTGQWKL